MSSNEPDRLPGSIVASSSQGDREYLLELVRMVVSNEFERSPVPVQPLLCPT